jgi:hypothetical protein
VSDLIKKIRAAIDEDERIALAANPGPWRFRIPNANHLDQYTIFGDGQPRGRDKLRNVCSVDLSWEKEANAAHIVLHNPDRVLAMVAAHREILELIEVLRADYQDNVAEHLLVTLAKGYGIEVES